MLWFSDADARDTGSISNVRCDLNLMNCVCLTILNEVSDALWKLKTEPRDILVTGLLIETKTSSKISQ